MGEIKGFQDFQVAPSDLSTLDLKFRSQLLKDLFKRLQSILLIQMVGYVSFLSEQVDELYIKIKRIIKDILATPGFEKLLLDFPSSIPESIHSTVAHDYGSDWEELVLPDLNKYFGKIIEFCVENNAGYGDCGIVIMPTLESFDKFINDFNKAHENVNKTWLAKVNVNANQNMSSTRRTYINQTRIDEINNVLPQKFDLSKVIRLCEEINICFGYKCYFALSSLLRTLIDHISPIFGLENFSQVANNYPGSKSFKDAMIHLDNSLRKIADLNLHSKIMKKETLLNENSINFSSEIDLLLSEIVKLLS